MAHVFRYHRLRIRNETDTADAITITSSGLSGLPYLKGPPKGDGQKIDIRTGRVDIGAYNYEVVDNGVVANSITAALWDVLGRVHLLNRVALGEWGTNGVDFPNVQIAGYVNSLHMPDAGLFQITVGESRRIEQTHSAFKSLLIRRPNGTEEISLFDRFSSITGGPVRGGFGPIPDYGGWLMEVKSTGLTGNTVVLGFVVGYVPTTSGFKLARGGLVFDDYWRLTNTTNAFAVASQRYKSINSHHIFPRLRCHVLNAATQASIGYYMPIGGQSTNPSESTFFRNSDVLLTGWAAPPSVGTRVSMYTYPVDVSEQNPLHILMHPVRMVANLYIDSGQAVNETTVTNTINGMGPGLLVALRITEAPKLADFERPWMGLFGFGIRRGNSGQIEFFNSRLKLTADPDFAVNMAKMRSMDFEIFDIDESSIVNRVIVKQRRFSPWQGQLGGASSFVPVLDFLTEVPHTTDIDNGDSGPIGNRDLTFDIPGAILTSVTPEAFVYQQDTAFDGVIASAAREFFDRFGRGAVTGRLPVDATFPKAVGDEFIIDLPFRPNKNNIRGGQRAVQVTKKTNVDDGFDVDFLDSGALFQASTAPVFTLVTDADLPKSMGVVTVTNAATLIAESHKHVRFEWGFGASSPTDHGAPLNAIDVSILTVFRTPRVNMGAVLWVRAQAIGDGVRGSAWSAWQSLDLANIAAPSGLAIADVNTTSVDLTWTNGDATIPVLVMMRGPVINGENLLAYAKVIAELPAGSVTYRVSGLTEGGHDFIFHVKHKESEPYKGESDPSAEVTKTTGGAGTLETPQNPRAFAGRFYAPLTGEPLGSGSVGIDGSFGMDAIATEFPSSMEMWVAVETGVASGVYGSYALAATMPSRQGVRTGLTAIAPSDKLRRKMKARIVAAGRTPSAYTPEVGPVSPWTLSDPADYPVPAPGDVTASVVYTTSDKGEVATIRLAFTPPADVQFKRMEWQVKSRPPGATDFSGSAIVAGTKTGPDFIPADFSTEYLINPITVTEGDVSFVGASIAVISVAARLDPTPTFGTPVATSGYIEYGIVGYDDETKRIEVWSQSYTTQPDTTSVEKAVGATRYADFNKGDGRLLIQLAVDATNDWRKTTFVPYDKDQNRGPITTFVTERQTPTPPGAPGSWAVQSNPNPFTGSIIRRVTLNGSAIAGWKVRTYRNGSAYGTDRTLVAGDITNTYVDVTDSGVAASTTYNYKDTHIDLALTEGASNTEAGLTTYAASTLNAPGSFDNDQDLCEDHLSWTANGNPAGCVYEIHRSTTGSGGTYTLYSTPGVDVFSTDIPKYVSAVHYKARAIKAGYPDSALTGAVSAAARDGSCAL